MQSVDLALILYKDMPSKKNSNLIPVETIRSLIFLIRDQKVMIDQDIAQLYEVETKVLNQAVKRNIGRFPEDFMFQLTKEEFDILKSQIVTSSWGGRRTPPYAFTEQGLAMLSGVLNSKRAIEVNIAIMRTFVQLRSMLTSHDELSKKLKNLEKKYDSQFKIVFDAIREIMNPNKPLKKDRLDLEKINKIKLDLSFLSAAKNLTF